MAIISSCALARLHTFIRGFPLILQEGARRALGWKATKKMPSSSTFHRQEPTGRVNILCCSLPSIIGLYPFHVRWRKFRLLHSSISLIFTAATFSLIYSIPSINMARPEACSEPEISHHPFQLHKFHDHFAME